MQSQVARHLQIGAQVMFALLGAATIACAAGKPGAAAAIEAVIEADSRLGAERNEATHHMPIAKAVEAYVSGLDALDLEATPPDFRRALRRHRDAWQQSIALFEQFPDLRGEMHEVFEAIRGSSAAARAGLEAKEERIWSTWAEVEAAVARHPDRR